MRILHVINGLAVSRGGPSATVAALAEAQARRGHEVVVLSTVRQPASLTLQPDQQDGLTVCELHVDQDSTWYNAKVFSALRYWARDRDVVHVHGSWRYHLRAAANVCRDYKVPYVIQPHGNLGAISRNHKWYIKRPYFYLFEREAFNHAAAVLCTSEKELRELSDLRLSPRKFVVPNAVSLEERSAQIDPAVLQGLCPQLESHHKVILYLGRITWIKRVNMLVDAFIRLHREFPEWRLVLAGPHEDQRIVQQVRQQAEAHGIAQRVLMPGTVLGEAKAALLSRADIFSLPSLHENFGVSAVEALHYGTPCVMSSGVALAQAAAAEGAALVCESNPEEFSSSLQALMSDEKLRAEFGRRGIQMAARYRPDTIAERLDAAYQTCIDSPVEETRKAPLRKRRHWLPVGLFGQPAVQTA